MPVFYDLRKDIRFKQGVEEATRASAIRMLRQGSLSIQMLAEGLGVSLDFILQIQKELEKSTIKRVKKTPLNASFSTI